MTSKQRELAKSILQVLNGMDGGQMQETVLHAQVNLGLPRNASFAEFNDALAVCDANGWVTGVSPRYGGSRLWNISDSGQAARLEMR